MTIQNPQGKLTVAGWRWEVEQREEFKRQWMALEDAELQRAEKARRGSIGAIYYWIRGVLA